MNSIPLGSLAVLIPWAFGFPPSQRVPNDQGTLPSNQFLPHLEQPLMTAGNGFQENLGQWPAWVRFAAQGPQGRIGVEDGALYLESNSGAVRMVFRNDGARPSARGSGKLPGLHHYFLGNDSARWFTGARSFESVRLTGVALGVDVVVRTSGSGWKYDIEAEPHGRWQDLRIEVENGTFERRAGPAGLESWTVRTEHGALQHLPAPAWQLLPDGTRRPVEVRFQAQSERCLMIASSNVDPALPLTIDPELAWSTYFGATGIGPGDFGIDVAWGPDGSLTLTGECSEGTFPATSGTFQSPGSNHARDLFVARFAGADGSLLYASRIGGSGDQERPSAVMVDAQGRATVVGNTDAPDFPTTPNGIVQSIPTTFFKTYVLRLSATGDALEFSTLLPSAWHLTPTGAALDHTSGGVVIAGTAGGFPGGALRTTPGCLQSTPARSFLAKVDSTGTSLEFATYFLLDNELITDVRVGPGGMIGICGDEANEDFPVTPGAVSSPYGFGSARSFICLLPPDGSQLLWSGVIGARRPVMFGTLTQVAALAFLENGDVCCVGFGPDSFPITPGAYAGAFIPGGINLEGVAFRLRGNDGALLHSTFWGGPGGEFIGGCEVDASGTLTVVGQSSPGSTSGLVTTRGAFDTSFNGGFSDLYVLRLDPKLSRLLYSTLLGGSTLDSCNQYNGENFGGLELLPSGRVGACGSTESLDFPTTPGSFSPNFFGGPSEAVAFALDLVLEGTSILGASTPGCTGPIALLPYSIPQAGGSAGLYCTSAPKNAQAFVLIGQPLVVPVQQQGVDLWIDPNAPITRVTATTGSDGYFEHELDLSQAASGAVLAVQILIENPSGCGTSGSWSASHALRIDVP